MTEEEEMIVTPWQVSGSVDYDRLIEKFGTEPIDDILLERIKKHTGQLHIQLRRKIFFSHRDLHWILDMYESDDKFVLYTGRGPSGPVHIGHMVPWIFTKHLQDVFGAKLYFQMTDDEKFLVNPNLTTKQTVSYTYDNALDVIAVGFDPDKTVIISDIKNIAALYDLAIKISKLVTFSTAKAVFGFQESSNIGIIFFPAIQAVPCFLESYMTGESTPCLIPAAIDQDPYWRIARDIAPRLGYYKPAQIHSRFLPGLGKGGKMSASEPETCIFATDPPEVAERKIWNAFTGGRGTVKEQRECGGDPSVCTVYQYFYYLFEEDDEKIIELANRCRAGDQICGDCKALLSKRVKTFLTEHQKRRGKARDLLDKFLLKM